MKPLTFVASFLSLTLLSTLAHSADRTGVNNISPIMEETTTPKTDGWNHLFMTITWTGSAVALDELGKPKPAEVIYSGTATTEGNVAFVCYDGRLSVSMALEPVDLRDAVLDTPSSRRLRVAIPDITIAGEEQSAKQWAYMPAMKVFRARKKSSAAKLYNAAIRNDPVTARYRGDTISLNMPQIDNTFADFGADCGMGRNANT